MQLQNIPPDQLKRQTVEELLRSNSYGIDPKFTLGTATVIAILCASLLVRLVNLSYNTLFIDEAIYVNVGHEVMHGVLSSDALSWMFGSYLYPVYVAIADTLGGETGVRLSSLLLNMLAAWFVYKATLRLLDPGAAQWALLIFGTSGVSINLARLAVYDAMGVTFAAVTLYLMIAAAQEDGRAANWRAAAAGLSIALCFLTKYIGILLLPATVMVGASVWLSTGRSLWRLLFSARLFFFLGTFTLVAGGFLFFSFESVQRVFSGEHSTQYTSRLSVVQTIAQDIGVAMFLAGVGLALVARSTYRTLRLSGSKPAHVLFFWGVVIALGTSLVMMQIYHVYSANIRALWKHDAYTLVMLSPLVGRALDRIAQQVRTMLKTRNHLEWRLLLATCAFVILIFFMSTSLDALWGFSYSWPNVSDPIAYLQAQDMVDIRNDTFTLSTASTVYEYYLGNDPAEPTQWYSNWFFEYKNRYGLEGIQAAIDACALDLVILDDYFTADINQMVEPALIDAGYIQIYSELQRLNSGDQIGTRMYVPAIHDKCSWRDPKNS